MMGSEGEMKLVVSPGRGFHTHWFKVEDRKDAPAFVDAAALIAEEFCTGAKYDRATIGFPGDGGRLGLVPGTATTTEVIEAFADLLSPEPVGLRWHTSWGDARPADSMT
jgi:hypothetical protein